MLATFIGKSSCGFVTGRTYNITTSIERMLKNTGIFGIQDIGYCLVVRDQDSKAICAYSRLEPMLKKLEN